MHQRDDLAAALEPHGLILRGGFSFGAGGASLRPGHRANRRDPCCWSGRRVQRPGRISSTGGSRSRPTSPIRSTAGRARSSAASRRRLERAPFRRPTGPICRSSNGRCAPKGCSPSPLGILMHPRYGLWHAYRGALLFDAEIAVEAPRAVIHLCDTCDGKPCLKACPVEAYTADGFAHAACLGHVRGPRGAPCRDGGCLDRNACPYRNRVSLRRRSAGVPHGGLRALKVACPIAARAMSRG